MKSRRSNVTPVTKKKSGRKIVAESSPFAVVALGASAGGLEAYTDFFKALPSDLEMSFVLVQHLDPSHQSLLSGIIAKTTKMPVEEVRAGTPVEAGRVYVIPPKTLMAIENGVFVLTPRTTGPGQHLAVNFFMQSLAQERDSRAIGVILSGSGMDGTVGLESIKAEGGITFAQLPETAKFDGMPRSAIDSGCVDFVLPPREIARELARITRHPYVSRGQELEAESATSVNQQDFTRIIEQLRRTSRVDFSQYKPNTIQRRALRRMVIQKLDSVTEYVAYMRDHPQEAEKLYDDVLIPVTSFFRDIEAFEALKKKVYPAIVKDKASKGVIRMWAPGCSTGEETYSLAMTLLEFLGDKAASFQVQIFGTDLNEKGIQKARAGVYHENIAEEISAERLRRFFVKVDEGYRVNKAVRDLCVFARQNLATDPPFSQMNLVACRNLLIYLQPALQRRVIPILHYALKPSGYLVLGNSESVSAFPALFSPVDKKHKIYAKKATASRLHYDFAQSYYPTAGRHAAPPETAPPALPSYDVQTEADRIVLKHHAPVGVVVDGALEVIQFRGRTTPYLEPSPGKASFNVLKLARNGLGVELRTLIRSAKEKNAPVKQDGVTFEADGQRRILSLSVSPLGEKTLPWNDRHLLLLFEDVTARRIAGSEGRSRAKAKGAASARELERIKRARSSAQEALRAAIESEEALREKFQSANEEILSANEELQSTNEELETSKEELQSTNEELNTLNDELRHKNAELHDLSNDLSNFLNSTRIPIVMLDRDLRVRRVTPFAGKLLKVVASDVGRPLSDIKLNIKVPDLEPMIHQVLKSLQPVEREVLDLEDHWHALHILPYRTQDDKINGAVLAMQDIDAIKAANEQLRKSGDLLRSIINTVREPLLVLDSELRVVATNDSYLRAFKVASKETLNQFLYRLGNEQWNIPKLRALLEQVLPSREVVTDYEIEHEFPSIGRKVMLLNARTLVQANERHPMILLAIEDVTGRRLAEAALIQSEKLAASSRLAASLAHEINNPLQAVTNLMTLLGQAPETNPENRKYATLAAKELERVVHLVRQSLGFYRETSVPRDLNLEDVLDSVLSLYSGQIEKGEIAIEKRYHFTGLVKGYPGELRQTFSTLLVNAIEASSKGGRIDVRAHDSVDWKNPATRGIRLVVSDHGAGIRSENIARIFQPFFTTKGERGTGIGLWVTRAIIERMAGSIRVRSRTKPGRSGSCFSIFLPRQGTKEI